MDIDEVLRDKLAELDREIAEITAPPEQGAEISFGKRVGDGTAMAVDRLTQVATHERMLQVRADVVRAQAKRADGSYGLSRSFVVSPFRRSGSRRCPGRRRTWPVPRTAAGFAGSNLEGLDQRGVRRRTGRR